MINSLYRRIVLLIGRGHITAVNDSGPVQKMQVKFSTLETHDNLPRLAEFGFSSNPPSGADAVVSFFGGDRSNGVVIATGHQQSRPVNLLPGESMLYSQDGKHVYLTADDGIVIDAQGQSVIVNNASTLTVNVATTITLNAPTEIIANTALLSVSGDILDNAGTNTKTMAQMREIYNTHTHVVSSIQTGGGSVTSAVPIQTD